MKKRNLILIIALVAVAATLLIYGLAGRSNSSRQLQKPDVSPAAETSEETQNTSVSGYSDSVITAAKEYLEAFPAESYLLVRTNQSVYSPIPLNEDNAFKITQADGSENTVHIGKNSFYMESSNCENQNCVGEGEVTLENMNTRVLFNMVLCLPHQLSLEMITPEQAEEALLELYAQQEAYQAAMEEYLATLPKETEAAEPERGADS